MDKRTVEQIKDFLNSICSKNNFSLVDVEVTDTSSELKLVVFIDKDGGVFIDDCIKFMEQSTLKLDQANLDIQNTQIFKSKAIRVEDYQDLGTWEEIGKLLSTNQSI